MLVLLQLDEEMYLPCEMALLQFNLKDGIIDTFHTFLRPPDATVPLGYGYLIHKNANETHGLTMEEDPICHPSSSAHETIAKKIISRINPGGINEAIWPIYTLAVSHFETHLKFG